MCIASLVVKGKSAKISKSLKILWRWLKDDWDRYCTMRSYHTYWDHLPLRYKTCTWERGFGCHWYVRKKALTGEWNYRIIRKHTLSTIFIFLTFSAVLTIILILFFKLVYISFLALLSLPLSLFLSLIV